MGSTALLFSQKPLLVYNGELTCQTASGKTSEVALSTHSFIKRSTATSTDSPPELSKQLAQALMLKRLAMLKILMMCASRDISVMFYRSVSCGHIWLGRVHMGTLTLYMDSCTVIEF